MNKFLFKLISSISVFLFFANSVHATGYADSTIDKGNAATTFCEGGSITLKTGNDVPSVSTFEWRNVGNNTSNNQQVHHPTSNGQNRYYTKVDGNRVQRPTKYDAAPEGAKAVCGDGSYSFSRNHRGTCSHHGGIAWWLH